MNYYIAINRYRSSSSSGFGNTYAILSCKDREQQIELLTHGLPVSDVWSHDGSASYSTMGIRCLYQSEYREVIKEINRGFHQLEVAPLVDDHFNLTA